MRDHHLVEHELQVLLAIAGRRPQPRWGAVYGQAIEVLVGFGYAEKRADGGYSLTPEGVEVVESVAPRQSAVRSE